MSFDTKDAEALASELKTELKTLLEERDQKSEDMAGQIEHLKTKSEEDSTDIKGRLDETKETIQKMSDVIDAHEKKMAKLADVRERKTAGQQFTEAEEFKSTVTTSKPMSFSMEVKDITNAGNLGASRQQSVLVPEQEGGFIAPPEIDLRIRNLIPQGQTVSNAIRYHKESGYTNSAAPVAEGAAKPQSEITFEEQIASVQKIAHKFRLSMEILEDAPMLRGYIDGRGRYGLNLKEEEQLLTGNGTGANLTGMLPAATAYASGTISGYTPATVVDDIRVAKLQVRQALYPASGVVMNPETWAEIELLKDTDNNYLYSMVTSGAVPTLWGLPVVTSDSMDAGDFLVGAFSLGTQIWDRMGMTVVASTEDGNNFSENMVTILFEKRLALEITRPEALVWHDASA